MLQYLVELVIFLKLPQIFRRLRSLQHAFTQIHLQFICVIHEYIYHGNLYVITYVLTGKTCEESCNYNSVIPQTYESSSTQTNKWITSIKFCPLIQNLVSQFLANCCGVKEIKPSRKRCGGYSIHHIAVHCWSFS